MKAYASAGVSERGVSLIEVVVAIAIMAVIAAGAYESLNAAGNAREGSETALARMERIDRTWLLIESDLRNALGYSLQATYGDPLPAMTFAFGQEYWLTLLRGGRANPLNFPRTELGRVGYRLQENTIWRDSWHNPASFDTDTARKQKLLSGVESIVVRALASTAKSPVDGPWVEEWPSGGQEPLPAAIELTLTLEDKGELKRLFALVPGY